MNDHGKKTYNPLGADEIRRRRAAARIAWLNSLSQAQRKR
jgi:hypothetical protein